MCMIAQKLFRERWCAFVGPWVIYAQSLKGLRYGGGSPYLDVMAHTFLNLAQYLFLALE